MEGKPIGRTPVSREVVGGQEHEQWFVMRDLTRPNAKLPAYLLLDKLNFRYFTPMIWKLFCHQGKRERRQVPFMHDLLFVYSCRSILDPLVEQIPTLQYRFLRKTYRQPMVVRTQDMERFMQAVHATDSPRFYLPSELTALSCGRKIRIIGGSLHLCEGKLLTIRGSKVKRLLVELPGLLSVGVEVKPEYIEFVD